MFLDVEAAFKEIDANRKELVTLPNYISDVPTLTKYKDIIIANYLNMKLLAKHFSFGNARVSFVKACNLLPEPGEPEVHVVRLVQKGNEDVLLAPVGDGEHALQPGGVPR